MSNDLEPKSKKNGKMRAREIHEFVMAAFRRLGGLDHLTKWAEANPTEFYKHLWGKLIPLQLSGRLEVAGEKKPEEMTSAEIYAELERLKAGEAADRAAKKTTRH